MADTATSDLATPGINWNEGRLITLRAGDKAECQGLDFGQLYGLFFYNSAQHDTPTTVTVSGTDTFAPLSIDLLGTTGNQGSPSVVFVSGNDTTSIEVSVSNENAGAQVQAFIASVSMPLNTTGMNNQPLPLDGTVEPFGKFTRYYAVPATTRYMGSISTTVTQFISIQFQENSAIVYIANTVGADLSQQFQGYGTAANRFTIKPSSYQVISWEFIGNGGQFVWVNADSPQNSLTASISVQLLG